ncbi:MAG: rhodanese-like domain-containing protein [Methanothrix sp.]|nr:rhodanese-like domain-containing protein [Methanothrix sp.]
MPGIDQAKVRLEAWLPGSRKSACHLGCENRRGEYSSGHIASAINIDYRSPSFEDQLSMLDRDVAILLYCRMGVRSLKALQIMKGMGFSEIYNLTEGLVGWKRDGGETV